MLWNNTMSEYLEFNANKVIDNKIYNYFERRAANQLNRNEPQDQQRALRLFKNMIGASVNFALKDKSCCSDDSFLNRFLYAKKFNIEEAMQLLVNYLSFKENNRTSLQNINIFDEHIKLALRDGNPSVLKQRDRRGRKVITFTGAHWDPSKYTLQDIYRALLLTLDKLLENVQNQALGFVIIVDWTNFTFKQSSHLSPRVLKLMIEGLQDCIPAKYKGIHFILQPWYVDVALTIIKPFLNEKTKRRIIIHGSNLSTLHNLISKDILPPDLGGEGPNINNLDWYHFLLESSQAPEDPRSYRLIETAVYSKTSSSPNTMYPTIRKDNDVVSKYKLKS